jgi:uncharacterized OB-fold protein
MKTEFPLPDLDFEPTRGFWEAAQRESLVIPRCAACSHWSWYPSEACSQCGGVEMPWTAVGGRGTLFTFTEVKRALFEQYRSKAPYITGLVALEEEPRVRLATLFVDCKAAELTLDMPVEVTFRTLSFPETAGEILAPMWRPARG